MLKCAKPEGLAQLIDMAHGFVVATHRAFEAWV
jgi:hypothetical protein